MSQSPCHRSLEIGWAPCSRSQQVETRTTLSSLGPPQILAMGPLTSCQFSSPKLAGEFLQFAKMDSYIK